MTTDAMTTVCGIKMMRRGVDDDPSTGGGWSGSSSTGLRTTAPGTT
jgi:hypothetical protein